MNIFELSKILKDYKIDHDIDHSKFEIKIDTDRYNIVIYSKNSFINKKIIAKDKTYSSVNSYRKDDLKLYTPKLGSAFINTEYDKSTALILVNELRRMI